MSAGAQGGGKGGGRSVPYQSMPFMPSAGSMLGSRLIGSQGPQDLFVTQDRRRNRGRGRTQKAPEERYELKPLQGLEIANRRTTTIPPMQSYGGFAPQPSPGGKGGRGGGKGGGYNQPYQQQPLPQNLGSPTGYQGMGFTQNYGVPSMMRGSNAMANPFGSSNLPMRQQFYTAFNRGGLTQPGIGGFFG
jgi:hypothetical protein